MKKLLLSTVALFALGMSAPAYAHCGACGDMDDHGSKAIDATHAAEKHLDEEGKAMMEKAEGSVEDAKAEATEAAEDAATDAVEEAKEEAMEKAEDAAEEAVEEATDAAEDTAKDAAMDAAKDKMGL